MLLTRVSNSTPHRGPTGSAAHAAKSMGTVGGGGIGGRLAVGVGGGLSVDSTERERTAALIKTRKCAFFRRTLRGRLRAREGPANPNQRPRPTRGVHGSGAHAWVMVQRPSNGTNGAKRTEIAVWLVFQSTRFLGADRAGRSTHWSVVSRG